MSISNTNRLREKACEHYVADHVAQFGAMPMEFEFTDTVYDFDEYITFLSTPFLDRMSLLIKST